jgi:hypothetical protein
VCQTDTHGVSYDLGARISFAALEDPHSGVAVTYAHGEASAACAQRRQTTLRFECDVEAGVGAPTLPPSGVAEPSLCAYEFVWKSLYAVGRVGVASLTRAVPPLHVG